MDTTQILDRLQKTINECREMSKPKPRYGVLSNKYACEVCRLDEKGNFEFSSINSILINSFAIFFIKDNFNAHERADQLCAELNARAQ